MWGKEEILLVACLGFISTLANVFYMLGGTEGFGLAWRRYGTSILLGLGVAVGALAHHRWEWQLLLVTPAVILGTSLGYGANTTFWKIVKRSMFFLGCMLASFICFWATGFTSMGIVAFGISCLIGISSIFMGVCNPWDEATVEQFCISQVLFSILVFWGFIR